MDFSPENIKIASELDKHSDVKTEPLNLRLDHEFNMIELEHESYKSGIFTDELL